MRRLLVILLLFLFAPRADAQIFKEWFQQKKTQKEYLIAQIAALKVYKEFLQKGYQIAKDGLTLIGDIKDGDLTMHKDYFASLSRINPVVKNYSRVPEIVTLQVLTYQSYVKHYNKARESGLFSKAEVDYILGVYVRVLEDCSNVLDELITLTTAGKLVMKDDERIERIDVLFGQMQSNYSFTQSFGKSSMVMAANRYKEIHEAKSVNGISSLNK